MGGPGTRHRLALTGCTTSGSPEAGTDVDTVSNPAAEVVAETTEDQSTEAAPEGVVDFGSSWTWDDGL